MFSLPLLLIIIGNASPLIFYILFINDHVKQRIFTSVPVIILLYGADIIIRAEGYRIISCVFEMLIFFFAVSFYQKNYVWRNLLLLAAQYLISNIALLIIFVVTDYRMNNAMFIRLGKIPGQMMAFNYMAAYIFSAVVATLFMRKISHCFSERRNSIYIVLSVFAGIYSSVFAVIREIVYDNEFVNNIIIIICMFALYILNGYLVWIVYRRVKDNVMHKENLMEENFLTQIKGISEEDLKKWGTTGNQILDYIIGKNIDSLENDGYVVNIFADILSVEGMLQVYTAEICDRLFDRLKKWCISQEDGNPVDRKSVV